MARSGAPAPGFAILLDAECAVISVPEERRKSGKMFVNK